MKSKVRKDKNNRKLMSKVEIKSLILKSLKKNNIGITKYISFFLLIKSPFLSLLWLLGPTIYFLWKRNYKAIFKIWAFTLITWYFIFTTCLSICLSVTPILIGGEHTEFLLKYMLYNPEKLVFKGLCFHTVYYLDLISYKVGFIFYFPALINIFKHI